VPTSYSWREFAVEGGLMNYGADIREQSHQVVCAARILRGEYSADMPVRRPTKLAFYRRWSRTVRAPRKRGAGGQL
jgi:hypothetical protein